MDKIFVSIAAYEDPLLHETISRAAKLAKYPERIRFVVGLQYDSPPDLSDIEAEIDQIVYFDRPGVNRVRHEILNRFNDDYFLMIDSHMDFTQNWDVSLIDHYKELQSQHGMNVILSKPCSTIVGDLYESDLDFKDNGVKWFRFDQETLWTDLYPFYGPVEEPARFVWTGYACCHFLFADKNFVSQVGISGYNRSYCEEPLLSFMSYARGWDIYSMPSYNHVGHKDKDYNESVYGDRDVPRSEKRFGRIDDTQDVINEINKYILTGESENLPAVLPGRMPEDFFRRIGLLDELESLRKKFL